MLYNVLVLLVCKYCLLMSNGMANFVIREAKFVMHEGKNIQ